MRTRLFFCSPPPRVDFEKQFVVGRAKTYKKIATSSRIYNKSIVRPWQTESEDLSAPLAISAIIFHLDVNGR